MSKTINGKELLASAKAKEKQIIKERTGTPWYVKALVFFIDSVSAIFVLALAIQGAKSLLGTEISDMVKYGLAALIVGLLAVRLLERIFKARG